MSQSLSQFIYKGPHSQCLFFTLPVGQYLKSHRATVDVLVIVGKGRIEVGENETKKVLWAGEYILFEKNVLHSVRALEDSTFYLVKLSPSE